MKVTIFNRKENDSITYDIKKLDEETRQKILFAVHTRGWKDTDCFSQVEED